MYFHYFSSQNGQLQKQIVEYQHQITNLTQQIDSFEPSIAEESANSTAKLNSMNTPNLMVELEVDRLKEELSEMQTVFEKTKAELDKCVQIADKQEKNIENYKSYNNQLKVENNRLECSSKDLQGKVRIILRISKIKHVIFPIKTFGTKLKRRTLIRTK